MFAEGSLSLTTSHIYVCTNTAQSHLFPHNTSISKLSQLSQAPVFFQIPKCVRFGLRIRVAIGGTLGLRAALTLFEDVLVFVVSFETTDLGRHAALLDVN
jgi:hypothetical protein